MKAFRFLAVLMVAALLLSGCNLVAVNADRDGQQIVATVNGESITKKDVYSYAGLTLGAKVNSWDLDTVKQQKLSALENLIATKVILQKAKELKMYEFTADEQKQIDDYLTTITKSTYDEALKKYQEKAKTDKSVKPEELANKDVDTYLESLGTTRDKVKQSQADSIAYTKLRGSITKDVKVTDEEVKTSYESALSTQKTSFDQSTSAVYTAENNGEQILYYPTDGFIRIKHILIPLPDDVKTKISDLRTAKKTAEADKAREDGLKGIEATAKDVLAKAKAPGADLEALLKEYGKDPGMESKPEGYLVDKDDTTQYVDGFADAALALPALNTPSELFASDYGYHIIWQVEKIAKGPVAYDKVKDKYTETVKSDKQTQTWNTQIQTWETEMAAKIKKYTGRLS